MSPHRPKPVVLAILDGWGHREEIAHNAIAQAQTPVWNRLLENYPHGLINASELHVGLPEGQMGNSEVGHMNIGSGRVLMQELPKIDAALADGSLAGKKAWKAFVEALSPSPCRGEGRGGGKSVSSEPSTSPHPNPLPCRGRELPVCHLLGLLSPGGVHAHQSHMLALAKLLAGQGIAVHIHAFLDGRDTPPQSALDYMREFEQGLPNGARIATVSGRYYAMDRDKRWDRVEKACNTLTNASGQRFTSAIEAIEQSYAAGTSDEFILPSPIGDYQGMQDGDGLLMTNFRADRAREILTALLDPAFTGFTPEKRVRFAATLGLIEYSAALAPFMPALFPPELLTHMFGEVIAQAGLTQLRIAETEKYAHVTFFFNGGREGEFPGEERILVPSPKVATYDEKPEMSAYEITEKLVAAIESNRFDVVVVNYANTDMVGHTGDIHAACKAVETVDHCLGKLTEAVLAKGGSLLVTADHGNAEMMFDHDTDQAHTAHTLNLVPALIIDARLKGKKLAIPEGRLSDVAPTLLQLLHLPQPVEMTGRSLLAGFEC